VVIAERHGFRCAAGCRPWDRKNQRKGCLELVAATADTVLIAQGNQGSPISQPGWRLATGSANVWIQPRKLPWAHGPLPSWDHGVVMGVANGGQETAGKRAKASGSRPIFSW